MSGENIDPAYTAARPGVRVVTRTLSAPRAWRSARYWGSLPGRWLVPYSLKWRDEGPLLEDVAAPGGVQVEQARERVQVGTHRGTAVYDRRYVYRVVVTDEVGA